MTAWALEEKVLCYSQQSWSEVKWGWKSYGFFDSGLSVTEWFHSVNEDAYGMLHLMSPPIPLWGLRTTCHIYNLKHCSLLRVSSLEYITTDLLLIYFPICSISIRFSHPSTPFTTPTLTAQFLRNTPSFVSDLWCPESLISFIYKRLDITLI